MCQSWRCDYLNERPPILSFSNPSKTIFATSSCRNHDFLLSPGALAGEALGQSELLTTFITLYNCEVYPVVVNSPFCNAVKSWFWLTDGGNTAVLDLKAISEPNRIPNLDSDPTVTTSYGVGELLAAALNVGCTKIIINCEDTGALDGGARMLLALGARLIDTNGQDILAIGGGRELSRLSSVDLSNIHPRRSKCKGKHVLKLCVLTWTIFVASKELSWLKGLRGKLLWSKSRISHPD